MIGQFLEFSISARPIAPALEFYRSMGFRELAVGDILDEPYAALWDGEIVLGLHERELEDLALTFVRPDLKDRLPSMRRFGVEPEYERLADDQFHEAGFVDPNGQLVVLLEARTFSPASWEAANVPACGRFAEFSVATHSTDESAAFWQRVGFELVARGDEPHRWVRLSGHGLALGFHETAPFMAGMSFESSNLQARIEYLELKGIELERGTPFTAKRRDSMTIVAPDGTRLYLLDAA